MKAKDIQIGETYYDCDRYCDVKVVEKTADDRFNVMSKEYGEYGQKAEALYRYVPDMVDAKVKMPICFEENDGIDYPYYSPYLDENLYDFETMNANC